MIIGFSTGDIIWFDRIIASTNRFMLYPDTMREMLKRYIIVIMHNFWEIYPSTIQTSSRYASFLHVLTAEWPS
jgi:hypothetical protein